MRKAKLTLLLAIGQGGKAFGSITNADIAKALAEKTGVVLDRHQITLDKPIKGTGEYEVPVRVHADIEVILTIKVKAESDDSAEGAE